MKLRSIPLVMLALACRRTDVSDVWRAGGRYELKLALSHQPSLIPELRRDFDSRIDSVTLLLSVDSVVAGNAYGTVAGDTKAFPGELPRCRRGSLLCSASPRTLDDYDQSGCER